jgi:hypothetical protein
MRKKLKYILLLLMCLSASAAFAQYGQINRAKPLSTRDTVRTERKVSDDELLDSLRKKEDNKKDSVVFSARYIRFTMERFLSDSTQTFALDTGLYNFENYTALLDPRHPRISLGYTGVSQRPLLFEPDQTIGFSTGMRSLEVYALRPQDIKYYNARVAYSNLTLYNGFGSSVEQLFKDGAYPKRIKPNWNVGS